MNFTHLHLHSVYSLLDGIIKLDDLCTYIKESGMTSCAITDHGVLYGVLSFYKKAKAAGIKPLLGVEAYITYDEDGLDNKEKTKDNFHMILIAKNNIGYKNLLYLVSQANRHNFYYRPRISVSNLRKYSEGLIATSACLGGWVAKHGVVNLETKKFETPDNLPQKAIKLMRDIFGNDFYLEIQDNGMEEQYIYNAWLIDYAKRNNMPLVLTTDAHYLRKSDYELHQAIMAQQFKKTLDEYKNSDEMKYGPHFYVKTPAEMEMVARKLGTLEVIDNSLKIADECDVDIQLGIYQTPEFKFKESDDYEEFCKWESGFLESKYE